MTVADEMWLCRETIKMGNRMVELDYLAERARASRAWARKATLEEAREVVATHRYDVIRRLWRERQLFTSQ